MNVKDKIAKLLALAESPNEGEARNALLKARELMAQHKLRPEECVKAESVKVRRELIGVRVSKTKYNWAIDLSTVIAEHYCCKAYRNHMSGERMYTIGFVGLEDDFEVCKRIFLYAFDCVKTRADQIFNESPAYWGAAYRRSLAESYGAGFVSGLQSAFRRQDQDKQQEWGLVMVVPQAVNDAMTGIRIVRKPFAQVDREGEGNRLALSMGYADGTKFDPSTKLETVPREEAPALQGVV